MAKLATLLSIYDEARQLADQETTLQRFTRDEVVSYINKGIAEWWDVMVTSLGGAYCGKAVTVNALANTTSVALTSLASDFYKVDRVYIATNANDRQRLKAVPLEEEWSYLNMQAGRPTHYGIDATSLWLYPKLDRTYSLQLRYIPVAPVLDADDDEMDTYNAWGDTYAAFYAARRMALKDGEVAEAQAFLGELAGLTKRIQAMASNRDVSSPVRVADVREPLRMRHRKGRVL